MRIAKLKEIVDILARYEDEIDIVSYRKNGNNQLVFLLDCYCNDKLAMRMTSSDRNSLIRAGLDLVNMELKLRELEQ